MLALLLCFVCVSTVWADTGIASGDVGSTPLPIESEALEKEKDEMESGRVAVSLSVICEENAALEFMFRETAEEKLRALQGVSIADSPESASIMLSFVVFATGVEDLSLPSRVVYSFAYGMPELTFIEDELISLPRFIYHEPVISTVYLLERSIEQNIREADEYFIGILRKAE